jgi:hypothetical protein
MRVPPSFVPQDGREPVQLGADLRSAGQVHLTAAKSPQALQTPRGPSRPFHPRQGGNRMLDRFVRGV